MKTVERGSRVGSAFGVLVTGVAWAGLVASGCSESEGGKTGLKCGSGTVERDGACVVGDGGAGAGDGGARLDAGREASPRPDPCADLGLKGSPMVEVKRPDGSSFCMDGALISVAEYQEFVASNPVNVAGEACARNLFDPKEGRSCELGFPAPGTPSTAPMGCIDWCDASAYCAWAGKHLCGTGEAVLPDGGNISADLMTGCLQLESGGRACTSERDGAVQCPPLSDLLTPHVEWSSQCGYGGPQSVPCCVVAALNAGETTCGGLELGCLALMRDETIHARCCADSP